MNDVPRTYEDVNNGTATFIVCWTLTAIVAVALIFRYAVKIWIRWAVPHVSAPEKSWGLEDILFFTGYAVDVIHMTTVELSSHWGLGRHAHLEPLEQAQSLKYGLISQPFGVIAAMISRTGMAWTLLTCFTASDKRMRLTILACMLVQVVINTVGVLQMVLQCGPYPYHPVSVFKPTTIKRNMLIEGSKANRLGYFHYMWDMIPADGSVKCQSPSVQMTIGFVQGGLNTVIDLFLATVAAIEAWQFFIQTDNRKPGVSAWSHFRRISGSVRFHWIWQTATFSGPLLLAGAASIVKTYRSKSLGDELTEIAVQDNTVSFILWTKIENYSILLASSAPIARLFLSTLIDYRHNHNEFEMHRHRRDKSNSTTLTGSSYNSGNHVYGWEPFSEGYNSRVSKASLPAHLLDGCVQVKTDILVEVDKRQSRSLFKSWQAPKSPKVEDIKDIEARLERQI